MSVVVNETLEAVVLAVVEAAEVVVVVVVVESEPVSVVGVGSGVVAVVESALEVSGGTSVQSTTREQMDVALQKPLLRRQPSRKPPQLAKQQRHHCDVLGKPKLETQLGHTSAVGAGVPIAAVVVVTPMTVVVVVVVVAMVVVVGTSPQ